MEPQEEIPTTPDGFSTWVHEELKKLAFYNASPVDIEIRLVKLTMLGKPFGISRSALNKAMKGFMEAKAAAATAAAQAAIAPHVSAFNERYFVWRNGSKVRIGELVPRQLNGHSFFDLVGYTALDFRIATANVASPDGTLVADMWLASQSRREAMGTTLNTKFAPFTIVGDRLNIWQGFGINPAPGDYQWFTKHLVRLLGPKHAGYLLYWLAYGVQHPERPIGTAVILIGDQGTGKGVLGNCIRSIFGPHGATIYTTKALIGDFNAHLRNCCFLFLDEPPFAGDRKGADVLKHLITEPTIRIEPKGIDSEEIDNRIKILAATNHQWAAHIEPTDRRFVVFEVSAELKGDVQYFREFMAKVEDPACKAAVLDFLLKLDITKFSPERDRPVTHVYARQKAASLTGDWLFWRQVTEQDDFNIGRGAKDNFPLPIPHHGWMGQTDIYRRYAAWHSAEVGRGSPVIPDVFWKNFRRWCGEVHTRRDPHGTGERQRRIELPRLRDLGRRLAKHLGDDSTDDEA